MTGAEYKVEAKKVLLVDDEALARLRLPAGG